ncbi:MAG TPA: hypothetical protein VK002_15120, partial [Rubricoccaceae bacterium]|nr:hypothetical protein [Rubricoccaceae bacterium]
QALLDIAAEARAKGVECERFAARCEAEAAGESVTIAELRAEFARHAVPDPVPIAQPRTPMATPNGTLTELAEAADLYPDADAALRAAREVDYRDVAESVAHEHGVMLRALHALIRAGLVSEGAVVSALGAALG